MKIIYEAENISKDLDETSSARFIEADSEEELENKKDKDKNYKKRLHYCRHDENQPCEVTKWA